jgi:hemerythrin
MPASWSEAFATGVAEMDAQHRELLEQVSRLLAAMEREPAAVGRALDFLGDYVVSHFDAERRLMEAHGYPGAEAHAAAHEGFVRAFGRLRFDYDLDGLSDGMRELVGGWMVGWLKGHILEEDRALGRWLTAQGRAEAALSPGRTWVVPSGAALRVLSVAPGKALQRAGVLPGDLILALGGKRVTEIGVDRAVATLSAPGAGGLTLTVHPGGDRERIVTRFLPRRSSPGVPSVR